MRKTIAFLLAALLGTALLLGACSAKADAPMYRDIMYEAEATMPADFLAASFGDGDYLEKAKLEDLSAAGGETGAPKQDALAGRKIIKDVSASVDTRQFDQYLAAVEGKVAALGGYVERSEVSDNSYYYSSMRNATLVLRVPADALEDFKSSLGELGKVTSLSESVRDITANYTDVAAHIKAMEEERDALRKLMNQDSLENLLMVRDRLTDVLYRLDSLESQMRVMEDQISLSTVTLRVYEVERVTPDPPEGFWARTWSNFWENLADVIDGLVNFLSGLLSSIPYLVVIGGPIALVVWLVIRRRRKKKGK